MWSLAHWRMHCLQCPAGDRHRAGTVLAGQVFFGGCQRVSAPVPCCGSRGAVDV